MKNLGVQFCLGAWASIAVGMGIMSRSWETFFSLMAICAFFAVGFAATAAMRSKLQPVRWAGIAANVAFYGVILGGLLSGIERVYLVNGTHYPAFLASADIGPTNDIGGLFFVGAKSGDRVRSVIDAAPGCSGQGAELHQKDGGLVVIRCGGMMWYDSHTYLAHVETKR